MEENPRSKPHRSSSKANARMLKRKPSVESSDSGVKVIIRVKPPNKDEEEDGGNIVQKISQDSLSISGQTFTYDSVAQGHSSQTDIFELIGVPLIENCLSGFNSSVFAYGQTGSGKTYTIWGASNALLDEYQQGLAPRVLRRLFERIEEEKVKQPDSQLVSMCRCSFLEIYKEQITDLLDPGQKNLQIREDVKTGVFVENLREECVSSMKDVSQLLMKGLSNRRTGVTCANAESSRSHSVFTCVVESRSKSAADGQSSLKMSRINFVDLAGSQRQKQTGAAGERLKEAGNINRSLSQLGNLINILAEISQTGKPRHVPYRDSKLTFLLQDSLGGNAKLAMICTISPSTSCKSETLSTLRFAQRARAIKSRAINNNELRIELASSQSISQKQKQDLDTVEVVRAAGELLVRLKEADEAVAASEKRATMMEYQAENAYKKIDRLNRLAAASHLPKEDEIKEDGGDPEICCNKMLSNLPEEIIFDILLRIPIKAIFTCKCVCKSWLNLLETPEFTRSHLFKSAPGWLLVNQCTDQPNVFKIFEIERHELHHKLIKLDTEKIFNDNLPQDLWTYIKGSINGLILFGQLGPEQHFICNPITRECIKLPTPQEIQTDHPVLIDYGFGVSRLSGQYKVVRLFYEFGLQYGRRFSLGIPRFICQVYTLGTRSWRSIAVTPGYESLEICCATSTFLNGNLHWLVRDLEGSLWVSCFDLETEEFTKFRAPIRGSELVFQDIWVLRGCLCMCDESFEGEYVIYLMSCYEKKSWHKECVISKSPEVLGGEKIDLMNISGDGDVLMVMQEQDSRLFCYSNSSKKWTDLIRLNFNYGVGCYFQAFLYTPSFVSLKDFETKDDIEQHQEPGL